MSTKKERIKRQAQQIAQGQAPTAQQHQSLPGQPTAQAQQPQTQPQTLTLSDEAMGNILTATNQAIAALSQASAPLGYQKGVELSQAMNQFPLAMQQGFAEHQQATMGRFGADLQTFQRNITAMLDANAAPVLPASTDGLSLAGDTSKAITARPSDSAG